LNKANSATVLNLKNDDVYSFEILFPKQNVIKEWNEIYRNYFIQIMNLESQNRLLKESRDLLLPRLMSGKVGV
jgi:type I restriction enzyme S subunit